MIHGGHVITEYERGPNFLIFVIRLREILVKNLNQEIDRTGDRTRARCVRGNMLPLDHSGVI